MPYQAQFNPTEVLENARTAIPYALGPEHFCACVFLAREDGKMTGPLVASGHWSATPGNLSTRYWCRAHGYFKRARARALLCIVFLSPEKLHCDQTTCGLLSLKCKPVQSLFKGIEN